MSVAIGTCKECMSTKEFTCESVLFKRNRGERFSYTCSSCSGKPSCSLCDVDECALYKCIVCKHAEKRICEKCNDEYNHSEPWKCATCKHNKTDKSEYIKSCFELHKLMVGLEKDSAELTRDRELVVRYEKEIERLTKEVANLKNRIEITETKLKQGSIERKRHWDDSFNIFKKIKH